MRVDGPDGLKVVAPQGETTHYILCVAVLLQNVFAVHRLPAAGCVEGLWTRPLGVRVQRVQRVQRVVVAADAADFKKGARLRRRLCRRVAPHRGNDSL